MDVNTYADTLRDVEAVAKDLERLAAEVRAGKWLLAVVYEVVDPDPSECRVTVQLRP